MTEGQALWLLFSALYLLECCIWLPEGMSLLTGPSGGWRMRGLTRLLGLRGRRLVFISLAPQALVVLTRWRLVPAAEALVVHGGELPQCVPWAELRPGVVEKKLHLAPGVELIFGDEASAKAAAERVRGWQGMEPSEREAAFLQEAAASLDTEGLKTQAQTLAWDTALTRALSWVLLLWCFGVIAVIYRWLGDGPEVLWVAGALVLLLWVQAWHFWKSARHAGVRHRLGKTLAAAFLPQHAMRAADELCLARKGGFHPLAARALMAPEAWLGLARALWKEAQYGGAPGADLEARALEAFFAKQAVPLLELEPVPLREPGALAYCPRCQAQYHKPVAGCHDCAGLPLREFPTE